MKYLLIPLLLLAQPVSAAQITAKNIFVSVNHERTAHHLQALHESTVLETVAQNRLQDMQLFNYFSHTSPYGVEWKSWFLWDGYLYTAAGENLARDFPSTKRVVAAWMASDEHRQNILDPSYTETGIATDGVITVQEFGDSVPVPEGD